MARSRSPLDDRSLDDAIAAIRRSGATSVAVCFLHSYLNPVHELAAVERLARELPDISISQLERRAAADQGI